MAILIKSALLVCIAGLGGCSRCTYVDLWNNTGSKITLHLNGDMHEISQGKFWRGTYSRESERPKDREFQIEAGKNRWAYTKKFGWPECFEPPSRGICYGFQVEPDGAIWQRPVHAPAKPLPVEQLQHQPDGFPMRPE